MKNESKFKRKWRTKIDGEIKRRKGFLKIIITEGTMKDWVKIKEKFSEGLNTKKWKLRV